MQTTILQALKADELRRIVRRTATKVRKPRRQTLLLLQKRGLRLRSERRRATTELLLLQRRRRQPYTTAPTKLLPVQLLGRRLARGWLVPERRVRTALMRGWTLHAEVGVVDRVGEHRTFLAGRRRRAEARDHAVRYEAAVVEVAVVEGFEAAGMDTLLLQERELRLLLELDVPSGRNNGRRVWSARILIVVSTSRTQHQKGR